MIRAAPYCGFTLCSHHISPGSQVQWQDHLIETALYASSSGVVYSNGGNSLSTFGDDGCVGPSCGDLSSSDSCAAFSGGFPSSSGACTELSSDDVPVSSDAGMEFSGGFCCCVFRCRCLQGVQVLHCVAAVGFTDCENGGEGLEVL